MNTPPFNGNYLASGSGSFIHTANYIGSPPSLLPSPICMGSEIQPLATDGKYSQSPPFYQLGFQPVRNCPFFNYTMPNLPPTGPIPSPKRQYYWYYPYARQ